MSAWVAVDKDGEELILDHKPKIIRKNEYWYRDSSNISIPKGSIEKLIGRTLTWVDKPVELKEE
jgi:hypothetical protein